MTAIPPPVCPRCKVACIWEFATPSVGSGISTDRTYCPGCGWNPEVDGLKATIEAHLIAAGWEPIEGGWHRGAYRLAFHDAIDRQIHVEVGDIGGNDSGGGS